MTQTKFPIRPGVYKDETPLAAEGHWSDANWIRFRNGRPEVIKGYATYIGSAIDGICRSIHTFTRLDGTIITIFGTHKRLYAYMNATLYDVTPLRSLGTLSGPFTTTMGSSTVTVTHTAHGLTDGDVVSFSGASAVGGITLSGAYTISYINSSSYSVTAPSNATSGASGGGTVTYEYYIHIGQISSSTGGYGYGTSGYGLGPYGTSTSTLSLPRIWFLDNFGQTAICNPRGAGIYQWTPNTDSTERVTNGSFASGSNWVTGSGWAIAGGVATATASSASLTQSVTLTATYYYRLKITVSAYTTGTLTVTNGTSTILTATAAGTYLADFQASGSDVITLTGTSLSASVSLVSVTGSNRAQVLTNAPTQADSVFVTAERIVVAIGSIPYLGSYDSKEIVWSDINNSTSWTPDITNQAGDYPLGKGSRAIRGIASRGTNLIFTDTGVYTMTYSGDPGTVYDFTLIGQGCGLIGPKAVAERNGVAWWMSSTGQFYQYAVGGAPMPIPCTVRNWVFNQLDASNQDKVVAGVNAVNNEVWWFFPSTASGTGETSYYVIFNYAENHWSCGSLARAAWLEQGIIANPLAADATTSGYIYTHETGANANGSSLAPYLQSGDFDLGDGDRLMMIRQYIPDLRDQVGTPSVYVNTRIYPNDSATTTGSFSITASTQHIDFRATGRQANIKIMSNDVNAYWRLGDQRFDVVPVGSKR